MTPRERKRADLLQALLDAQRRAADAAKVAMSTPLPERHKAQRYACSTHETAERAYRVYRWSVDHV